MILQLPRELREDITEPITKGVILKIRDPEDSFGIFQDVASHNAEFLRLGQNHWDEEEYRQ